MELHLYYEFVLFTTALEFSISKLLTCQAIIFLIFIFLNFLEFYQPETLSPSETSSPFTAN